MPFKFPTGDLSAANGITKEQEAKWERQYFMQKMHQNS